MPYQVAEVVAKPLLALRVADADTGEPRRMSVHTGEAVLATQSTGLRIITGMLPREPCALFVPDARPIEPHETPVIAQAEAYLCGIVIDGNVQKQAGYGVGDAAAAYVPDPRGGQMRWLQITFTVTTLVAVRVGYRVTILTPA
ncbi:hypothetical protein ACQP00_23130 [Dactylosporangium sp. CS-047395]|uniref:hypothetical protein n=1 Tax=Dactylosporangium sp. CS-047395 TaxID=3239936 RepID=UPI003D8E67FF